MELFKAVNAPCIVYGETAGTIRGDRNAPLSTKHKLSQDEVRVCGHKMNQFGE